MCTRKKYVEMYIFTRTKIKDEQYEFIIAFEHDVW